MNILKTLWRSTTPLKTAILPKFGETRCLSTGVAINTDTAKNVVDQTDLAEKKDSSVKMDKLYKRVELEMRGIDPAVLLSYSWFCVSAASHLGIDVTKSWALRKADKERFTLLKSVHVHKKHKVQYEVRTYFRFVHLQRLTESTCDTYLEYIERNLPEGCALKVTKVECVSVPEHLQPPSKDE